MLGSAPLDFSMRLWFLLLAPLIFVAMSGAQSLQQKILTSIFVKSVDCSSFFDLLSPFTHLVCCSTRGPSWANNTNWNTGQNYCLWFGITCDDFGNVSKVHQLRNRPYQFFLL
jgi:hypothetical protein